MAESRPAHPPVRTLREPFERLVDRGLRLNKLRSEREPHDFLIDKATEFSGASGKLYRCTRAPASLAANDQCRNGQCR